MDSLKKLISTNTKVKKYLILKYLWRGKREFFKTNLKIFIQKSSRENKSINWRCIFLYIIIKIIKII